VPPILLQRKVNYQASLAGYIPTDLGILFVEFIKSRFGIGHLSLRMPRLPISKE
jgi:hypothetical protein